MNFLAGKKKTILIPSGPSHDPDRKHLFCILTDASHHNQHLLVPICSVKPGKFYDPTCVILPGAHSFIKKDSYVEYRLMEIRPTKHICKLVDGNEWTEKEDFNEDLHNRICEGIRTSKFTPRWAKDHYESWPQG